MNERPGVDRLRQAMQRANVGELEEAAGEVGRQAIATALAEVETEAATPERFKPTDDDRQRLLDEAWRDASRAMEQNRDRLGRRVTSTHDARVHRQIFELLRSMAAGPDSDFQ
jgi:hypothetical protein